MKKHASKTKSGFAIGILRVIAVLGLTLVLLTALLFFVLLFVFRGPSPTAKELLTRSLKETSAVYMIPDWFLSDEEIARLTAPRKQQDLSQDTSLISIPTDDPFSYATGAPFSGPTLPPDATPVPEATPDPDSHFVEPGIELYDVSSATYRGKLMIVHDPTHVRIGVLDSYGSDKEGLFLPGFIEKYNAVAVTNAGGFSDPNGRGNGGTPTGLIIDNGKIIWGIPTAHTASAASTIAASCTSAT